ncbi:MAG: hypothetical protein BMS9Abin33_0566 [Gammaproteobacteria bacterium]|nr:MAG: hypothetical protein BMS9Abin33_0566 [Gammaproteobacteria bacterium]
MSISNKNDELWVICSSIAHKYCEIANKNKQDINSIIHPFKDLLPISLFDIDDWEDAENFITLSVYKLALYYVSKNLPVILERKEFFNNSLTFRDLTVAPSIARKNRTHESPDRTRARHQSY